MAHTSLEPSDGHDYVAGDAIDIPVHFEKPDGTPEPIDADGHVEFRIKEKLTDSDTDALLTKNSNDTDADGNPQITIDDATAGECTVHILTDDTAGLVDLDGDGTRDSEIIVEWHVRLIDADGNRVTAEWGDWPMIAT